MFDKNVEEYLQIIDKSLVDIIKSSNVKDYLDVVSKFYHMDYMNQILIYNQNPNATRLAGYGSWVNQGMEIKPGEKPITLLIPKIEIENAIPLLNPENGQQIEEDGEKIFEKEKTYKTYLSTVALFDESQTIGDFVEEEYLKPDFEKYFREITGYVVRTTNDIKEIPKVKRHLLNIDESELIINSNKVKTQDEIDAEVISSYLEFLFNNYTYKNKNYVIQAVKYCVLKHFGFDTSRITFNLFDKLIEDNDIDALTIFYNEISLYVNKVIQAFSYTFLSFFEVLIINQLLENPNEEDYFVTFHNVRLNSKYISINDSLYNLQQNLTKIGKDNVIKLFEDKMSCKVFTFPYYNLNMDLNLINFIKKKGE